MSLFRILTRIFFLLIVLLGALPQLGAVRRQAAVPCVSGKAGDFPCNKVTLQAHIPLDGFRTRPESGSNVWGYIDQDDQREYAIMGLSNGTAVVDVTNPVAPRIVNIIPALESLWREVKVYSFKNAATGKWDAYAYVTTEATQGIQIIDLSRLPKSAELARVDREITTSHTAFVSNVDFATGAAIEGLTPYLYIEGADAFLNAGASNAIHQKEPRSPQPPEKTSSCGANACMTDLPGTYCTCGGGCGCARSAANPGFKVFSLKNPRNPKIVGSYNETYMHDVYIESFTGDRARQCAPGHDPCEVVFGWTGRDFRIIDFTDKRRPRVLSTLEYKNLGYPHSGWISKDKRFLFSFDELDEVRTGLSTRVLVFGISNFVKPRVRGKWTGKTNAIEHNGYVVNNRLYIAGYTRGMLVLNVKNPLKLKQVAYFDTHPENNEPRFRGAWGVYPFLPSGNILISDLNRGLFIVRQQ